MPSVGDLVIECATCGDILRIPIEAEMKYDEGRHYISTGADTSGLWLHVWSRHGEDEN